jgi:hypothetical protein
MKKNYLKILFVIFGISLFPNTIFAQEEEHEVEKTKFGIGLQFTLPAWGISGMVDVAENISAQGIFGVFADLKTYAARGIYRFKKETYWNVYGYGMVGAWSYTNWLFEENTETVMGFGAGTGIEYDWRALASGLPPLFFNLEMGLSSVNFNEVAYNFSSFMVGAGLHYRF